MSSRRRLLTRVLAVCLSLPLVLVATPPSSVAADEGHAATEDFVRHVDVGGHRLLLRCHGRGSPTVILEAALGGTSAIWNLVEPEVAGFTRVCSYDRAGLGGSEPGPAPRTSQAAVDELRTLLANAGVPGPYVLVAHSFGGYHAQLFARQDGGRQLSGVVFVDVTPIDWPWVLDRFGLPTPGPDQNPERVDIRASSHEVLAAPGFPQLPIFVLSRTRGSPNPELEQAWQERQVGHALLSSHHQLVVAEGAGHFIHRDRPDLVVAAIHRVVEAARQGSHAAPAP